jgi:antitoxin component YwqK of YwqJK toxin-antitoxin module
MFKQAPYNAFTAPFVSQATFADGKLSGHWTIFDSKQRRASEFELSDGQRHGMSTWWYPNGEKMQEAFYRNGVVDGELVEWNDKGAVVTRDNYQEGRKLAPKTTYYDENTRRGPTTVRSKTSHKKTEGMYLFATRAVKTPDDWWEARPATYETTGSDLRHGAWTEWYPSGHEHVTGNYQNDVQVGTFIAWYENGQIQAEGDFSDGKPHGHWTFWHANGQRHAEGIFQNGERIGEWSEWHEDGQLAKSHDYSRPDAETAEVQPAAEAAGPQF